MTDASNTREGLYTSTPSASTSGSCNCGSPKACDCEPGTCQCGHHGKGSNAGAVHVDEPDVRTVAEAETHIEGTRWNDEQPVEGDTTNYR